MQRKEEQEKHRVVGNAHHSMTGRGGCQDENQGKSGQERFRTGRAHCHQSQGKKIHEGEGSSSWQCQTLIKVKEDKNGGRSSYVVTKGALGDLWEKNVGEGRGKTQQQGVCVLRIGGRK